MNYQFFRDRAPSVQWDDASPMDDVESDMFQEPIDYHTISTGHEVVQEQESLDELDQLIVKVLATPKSTFAQSLFNSVNILMGIGLLSLPFAFNITGWAVGLGLLGLFAMMTHHTASLLQSCLDFQKEDGSVCHTFGDLGELAFGPIGRSAISFIFFFELVAACIALVILSADSIVALFPLLNIDLVKISIVILVFPLTIPKSLSIASYGSLIGILALFNLMSILIYDGLSTQETPGSIWLPAETSVMPVEWFPIPFAFGLLMAGFSGHSVFPNIYRDMAEPQKYRSLVNWTYLIIMFLYVLIASLGYLMFGKLVREEVTIFLT
jgi:vesicular inhibitory amino acid transporter